MFKTEQENNIVLRVDNLYTSEDENQVNDIIRTFCGIEYVNSDNFTRNVTIIGADMSREDIIERLEAEGFTVS